MKPTKEMIDAFILASSTANGGTEDCVSAGLAAALAAIPAPAVKTQNITREEVIEFLERACRNWSKVPHLSDYDLDDVAVELTRFSSARIMAAIEPSDLAAENERLRAALEFYANPDIYKPHHHGPAFDRRDLSYHAKAALERKP